MKPLKIFISGPITNGGTADEDTVYQNVANAVEAGIELIRKGHYPFIPHLSVLTNNIAKKKGVEIPWQTWITIDDAFLRKCDAVFFLGNSKGADIEMQRAIELKLPIYTKLEKVPDINKGD
jgi:hypothetical protein